LLGGDFDEAFDSYNVRFFKILVFWDGEFGIKYHTEPDLENN